ncbi:hypothetical protein [Hyphomonas sp.]|uniref:hypothetical protein n=1 Tax=Hyphomonas sp. TaxID=87 RepID=UPI0025BAC781|nr:hypothetical protein [Hyphomonas sp.]
MTTIYQNTRVIRVRSLQVILWVFALGLALWLYMQMEAGIPDSGLLLSIFAPVFGLFVLGFEYYLRSYVVSLAETPGGLKLDTLSMFTRQSRVVDWQDVKLGGEHHDLLITGASPSVDNQYTLLHLTARRLPLIVDTTNDPLDVQTLRRRIRPFRGRSKP